MTFRSSVHRGGRARGLFAALLTSLALATDADAQIDAIRRARDAARERSLGLDAIFGKEPPITTSIDDAKDAAPSLDGFEPAWYSPLAEMPRGEDGSFLLTPGTYVTVSRSFCLRAGTYGPQNGEGYLHAAWTGPKAQLIRTIITRSAEHPDVPQDHVQSLIWAILTRTDIDVVYQETKVAAARLLTPSELLELKGYGLRTVPDAIRNRALQSVPAPAREILEAEHEMRRLLGSGVSTYADLERVAVRTGAIPEGDSEFIVPKGRWTYHPGGFFIRYEPRAYRFMRIDVYYPPNVEIRRDASGRIISISTPDGRRFEPDGPRGAGSVNTNWRRVNFQRNSAVPASAAAGPVAPSITTSRVALLEQLLAGSSTSPRAMLLLARADYNDLLTLQGSYARRTPFEKQPDGTRALLREAVHSALARYLGLAAREETGTRQALEPVLRPRRSPEGYAYVIAAIPAAGQAQRKGAFSPYQPSGGGAVGPGSRQRLAPSGTPWPDPSRAPGKAPQGGSDPGEPDALDKAQQATGWMSKAADLFGAITNPAGFIAGQPGGQMLGAGMNSAFSASRQIGNSLSGQDDAGADAPSTDVAVREEKPMSQSRFVPVIWSALAVQQRIKTGFTRWQGQPDYQVLLKPKDIDFVDVSSRTLSDEQNRLGKHLLASTFRMAMALDAAATAKRRLTAAVAARDAEWQGKQANALLYAKRAAGIEMVQVAVTLGAMQEAARQAPQVTEADIRDGQQKLRADGFPEVVVNVSRQLGLSDADLEASRRRVLAQDPQQTAFAARNTILSLQSALYRYGAYLALLPEIQPPWN